MGYELKKLMNMYGVSTPTMAPAPQMPGAAPTALAEGATAEQQAKYAADKAAFDESMRKYGLNQAQYDQYARDYQNRLANTNMYNQAQFSTTGANVPPIMTYSDEQVAAPTTGTQYGTPQWSDMLRSPVYEPLTAMNVVPPTSVVPPVDAMSPTTTPPMSPSAQGGGRDRDGMGGLGGLGGMGRPGNGTGTGSFGLPDPFGGGSRAPSSGGYTGLRDMFDGGGPGRSGTRGGYTGLRDMFDGGGPGRSRAKAEGGYIQNYAQGGTVQGYQRGGPPGTIYGGAGDDVLMGRPADDMLTPAPAPVAEDPQDPLMAMYERYAQKPVDYSSQIAAATERRAAEQKAFEELLMGQLNAEDSAPQSKAEMYFRLAAAFGAPTKTGNFSENLALVGETMAEDLAAKSQREREKRAAKLGVQTELQKMRMEAAGEDLSALQGMQESETKYGREMAKDILDKYITSGKPQSEAGKIATDMGLKPGTPEYNEKVAEITELKIQREMAAINATLASTAAQQTQANQMNATEIKLRSETEDVLAGVGQSLEDLKEAYRLNPNTFAGGLYDKFVLGAKELAGSDDPKVVNTRMLQNLLESQALEKLKATFGGSGITNAEREALSALQGAGAKSTEERGQIILRAYEVLQDIQARQTKKLDEILSGAYRQYKPIDGGE